MSNLTAILNEHFSAESVNQLLRLANENQTVKSGWAGWLAGCVEPLATELQAEIDRLKDAIPAAQTESAEARVKADSAFVEWEKIAGQGKPEEMDLATAKVQAAQTADAARNELEAEKRRLIEAETRLARVNRLLDSLASVTPPDPTDVKAIAQKALF